MHGNHVSFSTDFDSLFRQVFKFMADYDLKTDHPAEVGKKLRNKILDVVGINKNESVRECGVVKGIDEMMVKRIELSVINKENL